MTTRTFTPFPTLTTERFTLRQLTINDAQDIFALRSDPDINKYLGRTPSKTVEDAINFIHIITENIQNNESVYWVISLTDNNTFAGTICLFDFSDEHHKCEIGYELLSKFQGKGIMQEAAKKVIEYAFQTMKIQTIEAFTHQNNLGSTKLLEKLEFKKVGEGDGDMCVYRFSNKI
jgi:ribosomal-protein-alanine N-acetyltransferase